ncbi:hypothetical protein QCA50_005330 [Cerrena zonata]|uniref:Uncharacterized protein n=1 Tax=Cerrena zonata TaxID=2478898 RepID=A0AAW0GLF3_9APHY
MPGSCLHQYSLQAHEQPRSDTIRHPPSATDPPTLSDLPYVYKFRRHSPYFKPSHSRTLSSSHHLPHITLPFLPFILPTPHSSSASSSPSSRTHPSIPPSLLHSSPTHTFPHSSHTHSSSSPISSIHNTLLPPPLIHIHSHIPHPLHLTFLSPPHLILIPRPPSHFLSFNHIHIPHTHTPSSRGGQLICPGLPFRGPRDK